NVTRTSRLNCDRRSKCCPGFAGLLGGVHSPKTASGVHYVVRKRDLLAVGLPSPRTQGRVAQLQFRSRVSDPLPPSADLPLTEGEIKALTLRRNLPLARGDASEASE